ncbi:MAG TPA: hypothetical protein VFQ39_13065 [Longimicrobium sp.]|nr:hypothetical protein [Longimicrobium sp.]
MSDVTAATTNALAHYRFRRSALEPARSFSLHPDHIEVTGDGFEQHVALSDVRQLHLRFVRTRQRDYYQCRVRVADGSVLFLQNVDFRGAARFEKQSAAYSAFVAALHRALLPHREQVVFRSGSATTYIATILVTVILTLMLVASLLGGLWLLCLILAAIIFVLLPIIPRSRPRLYRPESLPSGMLPK